MNLFDVYPLMDLEIAKGEGSWVTDTNGTKYLDLYGGHAVISIGHSHPHYLQSIKDQIDQIGFYSNSVHNSTQKKLAHKLGEMSGYKDYELFLCNSGAEAVENALKLASFKTNRGGFVAFKGAFHGRTAAALTITDNAKIRPVGISTSHIHMLDLGDLDGVEIALRQGNIAGVVIEGIQGVSGINVPDDDFLRGIASLCEQYGTMLILDEIQSGYGRTGDFFAHQNADIKPDLITVAKGMGNGFPIGGVLVRPDIQASYGLLGTTFGGNHLASAAGLAVLDVIDKEDLVNRTKHLGEWLIQQLNSLDFGFNITGRGLMLGLHFNFHVKKLRAALVDQGVLTGSASNPNVLRLLPPLTISKEELRQFIQKLITVLESKNNEEFYISR